MGLKSLHPAQNAELDFLRRAVDITYNYLIELANGDA